MVSGVVLILAALGATGHALDALALGLVAPVLVALLRRPQRGVLLLAALVPFDGLLILSSAGGSVKVWKEGLTVLTLAATFLCPSGARAGRDRRRLPAWTIPLALLLALSVVTVGFVGVHTWSTGFRVTYFYVLVAVALWRCPLGRREVDRLVTILMVDAVITAVYGVAQQVIGAPRLNALGYPYNSVIRSSGSHLRSFSTFSQPFPFAYFLMLVILVCLPVALADRGRLRNQIFLLSLPLLLVAMVLTFVRGALLGLAVGGMFLALRRHKALLLALPAALLVVLFLPGSFSGSILSSGSLGARSSGWKANVARVVDAPLGHGLGTSGASAELLQTNATPPTATPNASPTDVGATATTGIYQPDNYYYNTLFQVGVLGLWFMVMIYVGALSDAHRMARDPRWRESSLALGVMAFILAAMAASFVSTFFEVFPMDCLSWLLLGLVAGGESQSTDRQTPLAERIRSGYHYLPR